MEGLAAVAAAMQLVDYGLSMADSISALVERIRTAPKRFEQYAQQVDRLVLTAREIEQNPDLQTRVVCCYLTATLAEAKAAQHILDHFLVDSRKRRYWGVISGKSQRKILEHLDNLHHSVAELSLCIMSINMTQSKESAMKVVEVGGAVERTHMELVHVSNTLIVSLTAAYLQGIKLTAMPPSQTHVNPHLHWRERTRWQIPNVIRVMWT